MTVHPVIEKSPETLEVKRTKLPSIIDTTSLDYTSSDVEDKLAEKFKRLKSVTIDEKTIKMKPSKSSFNLARAKSKDSIASSDKSNKEKNRKSSSSSSKQNTLVCSDNSLSIKYSENHGDVPAFFPLSLYFQGRKSKGSKSSSWETDYSSK